MAGEYTLASIAWRKRRRNHRLLFGTPQRWIRLGWHNRLAAFGPGEIFAYERWRANRYGTLEWQIFVLQSCRCGEQIDRLPGIFPGAKCLLSAHGKPASKRLLFLFDELAKHSDLNAFSDAFWARTGLLFQEGFDVKCLAKSVACSSTGDPFSIPH